VMFRFRMSQAIESEKLPLRYKRRAIRSTIQIAQKQSAEALEAVAVEVQYKMASQAMDQ
jgi:hypothetical protein